jgi:hypothetical protein
MTSMAGNPQFGPAPDSGAPQRAIAPQLPRDPVALREAITDALAHGAAVGDAYASLVRPLLADAGDTGGGPLADDRRAVARSAAHAALAELAARLPTSDEGLGRRAVVLVPPGVVGELDARAVADGLEAGGWTAELVALGRDAADTVAEVDDLDVELLVVPATDAAQVLAAQLPCALLRRLTAPPLIVAVAFVTGAAAESSAVAADHVVGDVDALAPLLRRRLGGKGGTGTPWGVHLHRDGVGLVVSPIGLLDPKSVARLREIVETRRALYPRIVIDLRELLEADGPGLAALVSWDAEQPWDPTVAALGDPRTMTALADAGFAGALPMAAFDL